MKILVKALYRDTTCNMNLELLAGEQGLERWISHHRIQKQGLALVGHINSLRSNRVQILGKTEIGYLNGLPSNEKQTSLIGMMNSPVACIIITTGLEAPTGLLDLADQYKLAVFRTGLDSSLLISRSQIFLEEHLSPEEIRHGVLLDVCGVGIFLTGKSGIGKSECALDLILRGQRLIADDTVIIKSKQGGLIGTASPLTKHHMEVRGLGLINVKELFGAASFRDTKQIELIVHMVNWNEIEEHSRTGLDEIVETILNNHVSKITLPIRPGRNLASIIEVAARNHLLKQQGHNAAQEFEKKLLSRLQNSGPTEGTT